MQCRRPGQAWIWDVGKQVKYWIMPRTLLSSFSCSEQSALTQPFLPLPWVGIVLKQILCPDAWWVLCIAKIFPEFPTPSALNRINENPLQLHFPGVLSKFKGNLGCVKCTKKAAGPLQPSKWTWMCKPGALGCVLWDWKDDKARNGQTGPR